MTKELLEKIPEELLAGALKIVRTLQGHGHSAYFAGGVVRDLLLGRQIQDIDIASSARPELIETCFPETIPVGKQFGVVIVVQSGIQYEVATFRTDLDYKDGRHPVSVRFTNALEDALRRDFTVNAMFLDPQSGQILDSVEGGPDLDRRVIRTVGKASERFEEDKLRVLRAVRFACQLDFQIEASTWEAVVASASGLRQVSWERIRDELLKILTGPDPARGLQLLSDGRLLDVILPEIEAMRGVAQPPEYHPEGDVFEHTCLMFQIGNPLEKILALAVLLHDVGKPPTYQVRERIRFDGHAELGAEMAAQICKRLRLPQDVIEAVVALVRQHLRFINVGEMRESKLKRFLRQEIFPLHLELHRLDCLASHGNLSSYEFCQRKLQEFSEEQIRPPRLLSGRDLIDLGYQPGPIFSEILSEVEDQQLEGVVQTREEAILWVAKRFGTAIEGK